MKTRLTHEQKQEVLELKEKAMYLDEKGRKRYRLEKLAEAWMRYLDIMGVEHYLARHFYSKKKLPIFKDKIFLPGEVGAITRHLKKKKLIAVDTWKRNVVMWRQK